jgi:hypothetical protein
MSPFFMGLAAAEFLPADPAIWFEAATEISLGFAHDGKGDVVTRVEESLDPDRAQFLSGWLLGTVGGREALSAWLSTRNIKYAKDDVLHPMAGGRA